MVVKLTSSVWSDFIRSIVGETWWLTLVFVLSRARNSANLLQALASADDNLNDYVEPEFTIKNATFQISTLNALYNTTAISSCSDLNLYNLRDTDLKYIHLLL